MNRDDVNINIGSLETSQTMSADPIETDSVALAPKHPKIGSEVESTAQSEPQSAYKQYFLTGDSIAMDSFIGAHIMVVGDKTHVPDAQ